MSNEAVNWAMAISTAKPSAKLVLLCLAYHHNGKTGRCDPTVRLLVEETGLSNVTVMTALTTLEASLLLEKRPGHGRSHNAYILKVKPLDLLKVKPSDLAEVQSQAISLSPEVQSQILEVQSQILAVPSIEEQEITGMEQEINRKTTRIRTRFSILVKPMAHIVRCKRSNWGN